MVAFELMGENMQKQKQDNVIQKINEIVDIIESAKIEELKGKNKRAGRKISQLQTQVTDLQDHLNAFINEQKNDIPLIYRFEGTLEEIEVEVKKAKRFRINTLVR